MSALDWQLLCGYFAVQGLIIFVSSATDLMRFLKVRVLRLKKLPVSWKFLRNRRVGDSIRWGAV